MAEYIQCSNISFTVHNGSGWLYGTGSSAWKSTSYNTNGGAICFGLNSSSQYRALVIKFTTPSFPSGSTNKKINFTFPVWRGNSAGTTASAGTIKFRWRTFSTTPTLASQSAHNYLVANDGKQLTDNYEEKDIGSSYTSHTFTINASNLSNNQTYYLFIYSDTPTGNTVGCMSNNFEYANYERLNVQAEYTTSSGGGTTTIYYAYIVYNLNGGSGIDTIVDHASTSQIFYATVNSTAPTKAGYTFKGWATSEGSTTVAYDPGDSILLEGSAGGTTTNLYAIWESNTTTTTYYYKCYNLTSEKDIGTSTSTTSSSISRPDLSGSGYTYQGYVYYSSYSKCINQGLEWNFDGTGTTCSSHSSKNPYVVFFYTENIPTISSWQAPTQIVSLNGSSYTSYSTTSQIYKYQAGYVKYTTPSYAGKIVCQTTNGNFTEDYYSHLTSATALAASGINYTKAIETTYDLASNDNINAANGNFNTSISYECSPSTAYYWYVNGPFVNTGTYSISWKLSYYRKYSITFNANDGTGATSYQSFYADNTTVSIPAAPSNRPNHTFLGWSTSASATSATYTAGSTPTLSAQNHTLYAVWEPIKYYITVKYHTNDGSNNIFVTKNYDSTAINVPFNIIEETPIKDKYEFLGWGLSELDTTPNYQSGAKNLTYPGNTSSANPAICNFYAVWKLKGNVYYCINNKWLLCETYIYKNGKWVSCQFSYNPNGTSWEQ